MANHSHSSCRHHVRTPTCPREIRRTFAELPGLLASAPHRLLFLAGAIAVLLSMAWWAVQLTWMRFGLGGWPQPTIPPAYAHGMLIQYGMFPLFIFGFLLTVFPRWLNRPSLTAGALCTGGRLRAWWLRAGQLGLLGLPWLLRLGLILMLLGYLAAIWHAGRVLRASGDRNEHARSCVLALWSWARWD